MTVTDLPRRTATDDTLDALLAKIDDVVASTIPSLTLAAARKACNEAGVPMYQRLIDEALGQRETTGKAVIEAEHRLKAAKDALSDAEGEATFLLGDPFVVRSNRTWLAFDDDELPIAEEDQKSYDAAAVAKWFADRVARNDDVKAARAAVAAAEADVKTRRFDFEQVEKSLSARKAQLDAAVGELETYRLAISTGAAR